MPKAISACLGTFARHIVRDRFDAHEARQAMLFSFYRRVVFSFGLLESAGLAKAKGTQTFTIRRHKRNP